MNYEVVALNSARSCLRYLIKAFDISEIFIPFYICPAIRDAVFKEKCKIHFYHIDKNFMPIDYIPNSSFILYPNYFGVCSKNVEVLADKYRNLIVDNAHSFFSEPMGIASFNSVRKFFPNIKNGAFLFTSRLSSTVYKKDEFSYSYENLSFSDFLKNEYFIDSQPVLLMSDDTKTYFNKQDLGNFKKIFRQRFDYYHNLYSSKNLLLLQVQDFDIPFKYPLLLDDTNELNKIASKLELEGTNVFRYWNKMPSSFFENIFYSNLLAI